MYHVYSVYCINNVLVEIKTKHNNNNVHNEEGNNNKKTNKLLEDFRIELLEHFHLIISYNFKQK